MMTLLQRDYGLVMPAIVPAVDSWLNTSQSFFVKLHFRKKSCTVLVGAYLEALAMTAFIVELFLFNCEILPFLTSPPPLTSLSCYHTPSLFHAFNNANVMTRKVSVTFLNCEIFFFITSSSYNLPFTLPV